MARIRRNQFSSISPLLPETPAIVRLWILRLLVPLGSHRSFVNSHGFGNDALAEMLGLGDWIDPEDGAFNPLKVRAELRRLHQEGERKLAGTAMPACLRANVNRLSELVGLSANDCRILEFAVLIQNERLLDDTADWMGVLSSVKLFHVLSVLLGMPLHDVRAALGAQGVLARSGVVAMERSGMNTLRSTLNLLSDNFADHIISSEADPVSLLKDTVTLSSPAQLGLADYGHVQPALDVLRPYLKHAVGTGRKGVNIFLHGPPGTGKSQLAKALAAELGCELFDVASEDANGDPVSGGRRLRAFRAAQSFFAQRKALILFDEVEDVFDDTDGFMGGKSTAQRRKAWINRTLEENSVPAFWLSNFIEGLDPAFVRRFDMMFELAVPPKKQRVRIIEAECGDLLDAASIGRMASAETLAPAVVARAASVGRAIALDVGAAKAALAVELLVSNTLQAQGHQPLCRAKNTLLAEVYDASLVSADADLLQLTAGLVQARTGRLCLFGPPGTGKTAYGKWLASQLDMPLLIQRASDLMSMWVGGNEKNIAKAFRQAEQDGALLLIDEVDSFLQDRRRAARGWEVSMVNEMLTQMEQFEGVFIASTNLMDGLDQAALRRFDLKVKFDFLKPAQAAALLGRYCTALNLPAPGAFEMARLARLGCITPGDFAAVARQSRFRPLADVASLVKALEVECAIKQPTRPVVGFI